MDKINIEKCLVAQNVKLISGKWRPVILFCISNGVNRFNEIERSVLEISRNVLASELKKMEKDLLITRKSYNQIPPKVVYTLTSKGNKVIKILTLIKRLS